MLSPDDATALLDQIPCERSASAPYTPIYARPKGRELWALLVEKAFAKMLGGYE